MGCIETLIILPVAAFHLPVMTGGKGTDEFVADPMEFQMFLEQGRLFLVRGKTVSKFCTIISLNAFDRTGKGFYQMFYKLGSSNASTNRQREYSSIAVYWKNCFPMTWGFFRQAEGTNFTSTWIRCPG